jgi:hypothetical protein
LLRCARNGVEWEWHIPDCQRPRNAGTLVRRGLHLATTRLTRFAGMYQNNV